MKQLNIKQVGGVVGGYYMLEDIKDEIEMAINISTAALFIMCIGLYALDTY